MVDPRVLERLETPVAKGVRSTDLDLVAVRLRCRLGNPLRTEVEVDDEVAKATSFLGVISTIARGKRPNSPSYMCGG